jgi:hypothetical protein
MSKEKNLSEEVGRAKELLKVERQIGRTQAILEELIKKKAELVAGIKS